MTKKGCHPGNLQAGVQKYLKTFGCLIKNFRHDKKRSLRSERDGLESLRGEGKGESTIGGRHPFINPRKRRKYKKTKEKDKK